MTGQKYEFAKKWKIHIVNPKWLSDSLHAGYCLEEYRYAVGADSRPTDSGDRHPTSTPTKTGVPLSSCKSLVVYMYCSNNCYRFLIQHNSLKPEIINIKIYNSAP